MDKNKVIEKTLQYFDKAGIVLTDAEKQILKSLTSVLKI